MTKFRTISLLTVATDTAVPNTVATDTAVPNTVATDTAVPNTVATDTAVPNTTATDTAVPNTVATDTALPAFRRLATASQQSLQTNYKTETRNSYGRHFVTVCKTKITWKKSCTYFSKIC